jgi:hypothetical protein
MAVNSSAMSEQLLRSKVAPKTFAKFSNRISVAESVQKKAGKEFCLEKKVALAKLLENTNSLLEATNSVNIPSKTFFLDMITAVVPNLIASDIVSVQAMDNKAGIISYLRYKYGTTKGATTAGTVFTDSLNTGYSDPNYTSRVVDNELYSSGANLDFTPVISGTFSATDAAGNTLIEGTITGNTVALVCPTDPSVTGTLDYVTGAVTFTGTTGDVLMTYSYDNETVPFNNITGNQYQNVIPEMTMDLAQLPIYAKSRKLAAYWGFDAAYDLKKQYGTEINDVISTQAAGEISHEIDTEIALDLLKKAGAGPVLQWSKTAPIGVNIIDHYDSLWVRLTEGANIVFGATQRVQPNFILAGLNAAAVMECMRNFDAAGASSGVGPHFIGTLGGKYKVYVIPQFPADQFLMGYKGTNFLETGYVYAPYQPVLTTDLLMPADFRGQQGYATSYGLKMVNNKMYIAGRILD